MQHRHALSFGLGVSLLGLALTVAAPAHALAWRRFSAAGCTPTQQLIDFRFDVSGGLGLYLNNGTSAYLVCPVEEDSTLWVDSVTSISVDANNANPFGGILIAACVLYDQAIGASCGASTTSNTVGHVVVHPPLSVWNRTAAGETYAGDYPFLSVGLGGPVTQNNVTNYNSIRGYFITQ